MNAQPSTKTHSGLILTAGDVERLLRDDSPDSRVSILEKVSDQYNGTAFPDRERAIAEQIFRLLMKDAAIRVRETLAERIKENPQIPRDIVLHLAHDVDSVSLPVLKASSVLSDADLVNIVEASNDINKLMTISQRPNVSARVSDALVDTHYPQVVTSLLENDTALISEKAMDKIIDEFRGEPGVMETLVERHSLPITLVERLVHQASDTIAAQLKARYQLTDEQLNKDSTTSRDDVMLRMLKHDLTDADAMALVRQMALQNRLTASLVMTALCRGQLTFFTAALGHYAGVSMENARRLVNDKGDFGFRGIYAKSGLPDTMYTAIRLILDVVKTMQDGEVIPGSLFYANQLVERVLAIAGDREIEYIPYFIALIRQNIAKH